jgi:hypothetical protein
MHSIVLLKTGRTFVEVGVGAGNTSEEVVDGLHLMMSQMPVWWVRPEGVVVVSHVPIFFSG